MSRKEKEQFDPVEAMIHARRYLSKGQFFLALDVAGQVEYYLNEIPNDLEVERMRHILKPIIDRAWSDTVEAVNEVLPRR